MAAKAALVDSVKALQRSDPEIKQAWWDYCDKDFEGVKDPNRHEPASLQNFLSCFGDGAAPRMPVSQPSFGGKGQSKGLAAAPVFAAAPNFGGNRMATVQRQNMMNMMGAQQAQQGPGELSAMIKLGQKSAPSFKAAWQTYCTMYGGGTNDPNRQDPTFIMGFLDYIGQVAQADLEAASMQMGYEQQQQQMMMMMGGKEGMKRHMEAAAWEPRKKVAGTPKDGKAETALLVERVKALQRKDPELKQAWWTFTDENHEGIHDPNKHDAVVLEDFLATYEQ